MLTVQAVASVIFTYQMVAAGSKYFSYTIQSSMDTKSITDIKLPVILVCPKDQLNETILQKEHGYGRRLFNHGLGISPGFVSWEGKNNVSYKDIIEQIYPIKDSLKIFGPVEVDKKDRFDLLNGFCKQLRIKADEVAASDLSTIRIYSEETHFFVSVEDTYRSTFYAINTESLVGDFIGSKSKYKSFFTLDITEVNHNKYKGDCVQYGEEESEFRTYGDCVISRQKNKFDPVLGCTIPWQVPHHYPGACKGRIPIKENHLTHYRQMIDDLLLSRQFKVLGSFYNCPKPCKEIRVESKFTDSAKIGRQKVFIKLDKSVKVVHYNKAYGPFDLIVEVGSSLGLWIGLSAIGIFDFIIGVACAVKKRWAGAVHLIQDREKNLN